MNRYLTAWLAEGQSDAQRKFLKESKGVFRRVFSPRPANDLFPEPRLSDIMRERGEKHMSTERFQELFGDLPTDDEG